MSQYKKYIFPLYTQLDIDCTLQLLDNVIGYYEVSSNVEHVIEKGPGESGIELERYIDALNRLYNAQKYFEKNIPQSVELINVVGQNISDITQSTNFKFLVIILS